jgi:hypothetical protein
MIVHHIVALNGDYSQNSLEAICARLDAGTPFIEIENTIHAGHNYVLVHDAGLPREALAGV